MKKRYTVILMMPDYVAEDYGSDLSVERVEVGHVSSLRWDLRRAADAARAACIARHGPGTFNMPEDLAVNHVFVGWPKLVALPSDSL